MTDYDIMEIAEFLAGIGVIAAWTLEYVAPAEPIGAVVLAAAVFAVFGDAAIDAIEHYVDGPGGE